MKSVPLKNIQISCVSVLSRPVFRIPIKSEFRFYFNQRLAALFCTLTFWHPEIDPRLPTISWRKFNRKTLVRRAGARPLFSAWSTDYVYEHGAERKTFYRQFIAATGVGHFYSGKCETTRVRALEHKSIEAT